MSNLRKIVLAASAAGAMALGVAAPAVSQPYGRYEGGYRGLSSSYVDSLEWRINNAAEERRISWGEARQLRADLRSIQGPAIYRVETGQAGPREMRRVQRVVRRIEAATQGYARYDRRERYGYNRY